MSRLARESRSPADYVAKIYYEVWVGGLGAVVAERRLVSAEELAAGRALGSPRAVKSILAADEVDRVLSRGTVAAREPDAPARFKPGDRVRARNMHPSGHTRLPRYVRGHLGTIERVHGCHVFPDSNAAGTPEHPPWPYPPQIQGPEMWGAAGDPQRKGAG